jgi:hypothetical protein
LTSSSTATISSGSIFSFATNLANTATAFTVGQRVRVFNTADPTNFMEGSITGFSASTLTFSSTNSGGSGLYSAWTFVAAGLQGVQGVQAAQGTQGVQGVSAAAGSQGTQGVQGRQGVQAAQGTQGVQGVQGTQGVQGVQGVQAAQGTQGVQGVQGLQGVLC